MKLQKFIEKGFKITRAEDTITREQACTDDSINVTSVYDLNWEWIDTESANEKDYYVVEYSSKGIAYESPKLEFDEIDEFIKMI